MNAMNTTNSTQAIRPAAVAGMFYPGTAIELHREIDRLLAQAAMPAETAPSPRFPKALIVPHAGYIYSGPTAAKAYSRLRRGVVRRVVLLGPCHRVAVRGLALPAAGAFDTPLGRIEIDAKAVEHVRGLPQVTVSGAAHAQEHALEVQLPFLQKVLGDFRLVPFAVGAATAEEVAGVIEALWGGEETLLVISSDLSHYHPYAEARDIDRDTVRRLLAFDAAIDHEQACGATPIAGFLLAARKHGLEPELLDLRNSGDTAGSRDRVVGYASIAYGAPATARYAPEQGRELLALARGSIHAALAGTAFDTPRAAWLKEHRATFVTLMQEGRLRGCIGSLEAHRPLAEDVAANARAAASKDPRFAPVASLAELERIAIEVSVLSIPKAIEFADHADLLAQVRPGVDGLILDCGGRRGTFLPQVWDDLPEPEAFLAQLKQKTGLAAGAPTERCKVWRYEVAKWREADFPAN